MVFIALALLLLLRWSGALFDPLPRDDEAVYFEAFERVVEGDSPYDDPAFLYPPAFAYLGATLLEILGPGGLLVLVRTLNGLGAVLLVWLAASCWPPQAGETLERRGLLAAALLLLTPGMDIALRWGNLSPLIAAMVVSGLMLWPRHPVLAGGLLGSSALLKPLAPVALLLLIGHRPAKGGQRHWLAAGVGLLVGSVLALAVPGLSDYLALRGGRPEEPRNISLHRALHDLGLGVDTLALLILITALGLFVVRQRPQSPEHLLTLALALTLLAVPLVWNHTLLLTLPLQVLALARVVQAPYLERLTVALACLALWFTNALTGPPLLTGLASAFLTLLPLALALYTVAPRKVPGTS